MLTTRVVGCAALLWMIIVGITSGAGSEVADAAQNGDKAAVQKLIRSKADVNAPRVKSKSQLRKPLMTARTKTAMRTVTTTAAMAVAAVAVAAVAAAALVSRPVHGNLMAGCAPAHLRSKHPISGSIPSKNSRTVRFSPHVPPLPCRARLQASRPPAQSAAHRPPPSQSRPGINL